jgi:hypothetical protein
MKTKRFLIFGLPAVLLALGLAVCDTGGADTVDTDDGYAKKAFSLAGSFSGKFFKLASNGFSSFAAAAFTAEDFTVEGTLEDPDNDGLLIRLRGNYDPNTGNWSVSARQDAGGEDEVIYTIDGIIDSNGGWRGGGATVVEPDSDNEGEWLPAFFAVTEDGDTDWGSKGTPVDGRTEGGMPPAMQGYWSAAWEKDIPGTGGEILRTTMQCLVSDWKIKVTGRRVSPYEDTFIGQNQNIVEITETDGVYDVISCYVEYPQIPTTNFVKALADWLGLEEEDITILTSKPLPGEEPEGLWVLGSMNSFNAEIGGFDAIQQREILSFYMANGWDAWAANNDIEGDVKFTKYRFSTASNGDVLNMIRMVQQSSDYPLYPTGAFDSLAALEAAKEDEYYPLRMEEKYVDTGAEKPVSVGVLTVPFTRN